MSVSVGLVSLFGFVSECDYSESDLFSPVMLHADMIDSAIVSNMTDKLLIIMNVRPVSSILSGDRKCIKRV